MTRRLFLLLGVIDPKTDPVNAFAEAWNEWAKQRAQMAEGAFDVRERRMWERVKELWPQARRRADQG